MPIGVGPLLPATVREVGVVVGTRVSIWSPVKVCAAPERSALVPFPSLIEALFRFKLVIASAAVFWCGATAGGSNCTNKLEGGGTLNITGAAYFPNNPVRYAGGSAGGGASQCTQLIASTIEFTGNSTIQ